MIGNWESTTEEKFDLYRASTYFIDNFAQMNPAINASLLVLGKFSCYISNEWKTQNDST